MKTALITGITGQDGSYLAESLLRKNYRVIGLHRRNSTNNFERIKHINSEYFILEEFDITDPSDTSRVVEFYKADEFYNLAAQSHVATSFRQPTTTFDINTIGVINILEAIRLRSPSTRFYQASTSEMFGINYEEDFIFGKFQNESTPFLPQSPYAVSKLSSHRMVGIYREAYKLYACSGILFNHESPRRGENFVTRKITKFIGKLVNGLIEPNSKLGLGNLNASRDWGHAQDYVEAMYLMMNQSNPEDYVVSTGQTYTVSDFLQKAFSHVNLTYTNHIFIDPELYRPCEVNYLKGDSSKVRQDLGWQPKVTFDDLVIDMVESDILKYKNEKL